MWAQCVNNTALHGQLQIMRYLLNFIVNVSSKSNIETSQFICNAKSMTGFYMMWVLIIIEWRCQAGVNNTWHSVTFYIETSHLVCTTNQTTGFYLKCSSGLNWVDQVFSVLSRNILLKGDMLSNGSSRAFFQVFKKLMKNLC